METRIKDITAVIESFANPALQESYDNSGLIIGDKEQIVERVLVSIDCTEAVIDEAIAKSCNLIVSHHPIWFQPLKRLTGRNYVERTIIKAIKNNISIYAAHTNLDNVVKGVNAYLAKTLGLKTFSILQTQKSVLHKIVVFCPSDHADAVRNAMFAAGAGNIGNYDECSFNINGKGTFRAGDNTNPYVGSKGKRHSEEEVRIETVVPRHLTQKIIKAMVAVHPYEEVAYDIYPVENDIQQYGSGIIGSLEAPVETIGFLNLVKQSLNLSCIKHTKIIKKQIQNIAICGGSGIFLLKNAISANADLFLTADIKYHEYFDADEKIILADIGHYESEQFTTKLIFDIIKEKFPNFAVLISETKTNPINYL